MSTTFARDISNEEISAAFMDMNTGGVGVIKNVFSDNTLAECRAFVTSQLTHYGGEYFSLVGNADHGDSLLGEIGRSSVMNGLLKQVYEKITRKPALPSPIYQVLRVISGETAKGQSYQFHYDAYVVTALAPILIPAGSPEERGDLIIYPNHIPELSWAPFVERECDRENDPAKPIHSISCGKTLGSPSFQGKDSKYCPRESVSLPRLSVFSWQHASQGHRRAGYRDFPFRKSPRNELGRQPNTKMAP